MKLYEFALQQTHWSHDSVILMATDETDAKTKLKEVYGHEFNDKRRTEMGVTMFPDSVIERTEGYVHIYIDET